MSKVEEFLLESMRGNPIVSQLFLSAIADGMEEILSRADEIREEERECIERGKRPLVSGEYLIEQAKYVRMNIEKEFGL